MLYFCKSYVVFNFEVGSIYKYRATRLPFIDNEHLPENYPSVTAFDQLSVMELRTGKPNYVALDRDSFYTFVKEWRDNCVDCYKLFDWTIEDWIGDYIECIKEMDRNCLGDFNVDPSLFPYLKQLEIEKLKASELKPVKPALLFDQPKEIDIDPEFSWLIEDCLYNMKRGTPSLYEGTINFLLQQNMKEIIYHERLYNSYQSELISMKVRLLKEDVTIRDLDFTDPDVIFYLHPPFNRERIRTNYRHLKRCIEAYNS